MGIYRALFRPVATQSAVQSLCHIHRFISTFTHSRRCQTCKATANQEQLGVLLREPRFEPATFQMPDNPLYILRHCQLTF